MIFTDEEKYMISADAPPAISMAMRIVSETAKLMGATELVEITNAHVDGCVYFADSSVHFAEKLRDLGGRVRVPSTLNVGGLDLVRPDIIRRDSDGRKMAGRLMKAYVDMGCKASWTCAPYQAGYRPGVGEQIAWAESNAIVFANSVLGARTNRYGDYFDICAAITGRAPYTGLHVTENRHATILIDLSGLPAALLDEETFYPVLGSWFGRTVGTDIAAIKGIPTNVTEDRLKALAAASASTGAVALFHVIGVTPEAKDEQDAFGHKPPEAIVVPSVQELRAARDRLSTAISDTIDCVALGSPHFSIDECRQLAKLCQGKKFNVPVYVCTRHDVYEALGESGERDAIQSAGGEFVVGTCVVAAPILKRTSGVLMTNSGKFAHYSPATTGHEVIYGSMADCVRSAVSGNVERDEGVWEC
jgi:hypothetical protein